MKQNPKVSVCMITYGHEKFIEQAIDGVLMQECDFEVELIIANDCSPDQTDQIIQNILENHPRGSWVKYIKHNKNLGMMPNFIFAMQECQGKYIALCEGDDYWTDPLKLQKQVDFLEANLDYVLCFHKVDILKPNGEIVDDFITTVPENYETIETLARLGNYIHTPSVVFRNCIKDFPSEFYHTPIGDYFIYLILAEHGKLNYINEEMAVYRFGVGIHSTHTQIKMAKANIKLFNLLIAYTKDSIVNEIYLDRLWKLYIHFEDLIRKETLQNKKQNHLGKRVKKLPKKIWNSLKNKYQGRINEK